MNRDTFSLRWLQIASMGIMALVLLLPLKAPFGPYDEGLAVFNATRIMHGDLPYRDYWTMYPPAQSYVLSAVFTTCGANLLVERLYDAMCRFLIVVGIFLIARKALVHPAPCLLIAVFTTIVLAGVGGYSYPVFPALALCFFSIVCMLTFLECRARKWLMVSGALLGLASLFRWDIGLYALCSIVSTALWVRRIGPKKPEGNLSPVVPGPMEIALFSGVTLGLAAISYCSIGFFCGFQPVWTQVFVFPVTNIRELRGLPLPGLVPPSPFLYTGPSIFLNWFAFYVPLTIYGTCALAEFFSSGRGKFGRTTLLLFGVLLFIQSWNRYDSIHAFPTSLCSFFVLVAAGTRLVRSNLVPLLRISCGVIIALGLVLYSCVPVTSLAFTLRRYDPMSAYSRNVRAAGVCLDAGQESAVEYIQRCTKPGELIFVGTPRHDRIFINDIGFYFLADRGSATYYHELSPGVATTAPVQEEIVRDIEANNVKWVVLAQLPANDEPNKSSVSSGICRLDDYIASKYRVMEIFGLYRILNRRVGNTFQEDSTSDNPAPDGEGRRLDTMPDR